MRTMMLAAVVWSVLAVSAGAAGLPDEFDSLAGYRGVWISVGISEGPEYERLSLRPDSLTRYMVNRFTAGGVPASSGEPNWETMLAVALQVDLLKVGPIYVFAVRMHAMQGAVTIRTQRTCLATTWNRFDFGTLGDGSRTDLVREVVDGMVDHFIADWKKAHAPAADPFGGAEDGVIENGPI